VSSDQHAPTLVAAAGRQRAACSIRVSTSVFERIWRIVRKRKSVKFFVFKGQQWCESHPLRQSVSLCLSKCCQEPARNC
jgi:hypothetical protein